MTDAPFSRRIVEEALAADGVFHLRASGFSMLPFIRPGSLLLVTPLAQKPRPGDILLTHPAEGLWLCHRMLRHLPGGRILTKGDGNPAADAPVDRDRIVGRVDTLYRPDGSRLDLSCPLRRAVAGCIVPLETRAPGTLRKAVLLSAAGRRLAGPLLRRMRRWLP